MKTLYNDYIKSKYNQTKIINQNLNMYIKLEFDTITIIKQGKEIYKQKYNKIQTAISNFRIMTIHY